MLALTLCTISCGGSAQVSKAESPNEDTITLAQIIEEHADKNNIAEIKTLIETGDINAKNSHGSTALMLAALEGYIDIVLALIDEGADINIRDHSNATAYMKAEQNNYIKIMELLAQKGAEIDKTLTQAFDQYKDLSGISYIMSLVESGELSTKDHEGDNALSLSIDYGYTEIAKALIREGANVSATSRFDYTVLIHAAACGYADIVKMILAQEGVDINSNSNTTGITALIAAASRGHAEVVRILLDAGADVTIEDNENCSALIYASNESFTEIENMLREAQYSMLEAGEIENDTEAETNTENESGSIT